MLKLGFSMNSNKGVLVYVADLEVGMPIIANNNMLSSALVVVLLTRNNITVCAT